MNWIQKAILGKQLVEQLQQKAQSIYQPGVRYALQNGRLVTPTDNKQTYIKDGYSANDIIYSVVSIILDKVRLPEWELYKVVDESSLKKANAIMRRKDITAKDWKTALKLKEDSLQPISSYNLQTGKLNDLITYPNECETFQDFITYGSLMKLLTGDVYMWAELLNKGANTGIPNSLWILPSQYMNIKVDDGFPPKASSYELTIWNQKFVKEEILHEIYPNPNWNFNGEQLYGFAPLRAFLKNTVRNNSAKDASAAKFQNGGLEEIIYMDDQRYDAEMGLQQAQALKLRLSENEYAGPNAQGKKAISGVKVGVAPLGLSPVDLGIIDSEKWDAIMFCNGYGVPPELLGLTQKTYNNAKEAEKALTTRSAIPLLDSRRNSLNRKIQTDWGFKGQNIYIDYKTECFTELEADLNTMITWLKEVQMIRPDEQREQLGMEALNTPESKEVWVKTNSGYVPLSDFQANIVDQTLNNDTPGNNADGNATVPVNSNGKTGMLNGKATNGIFKKTVSV